MRPAVSLVLGAFVLLTGIVLLLQRAPEESNRPSPDTSITPHIDPDPVHVNDERTDPVPSETTLAPEPEPAPPPVDPWPVRARPEDVLSERMLEKSAPHFLYFSYGPDEVAQCSLVADVGGPILVDTPEELECARDLAALAYEQDALVESYILEQFTTVGGDAHFFADRTAAVEKSHEFTHGTVRAHDAMWVAISLTPLYESDLYRSIRDEQTSLLSVLGAQEMSFRLLNSLEMRAR